MSSSLINKATKGVFWSAIERFSVQGIQFVLSIIIARLLLPSDYGLIAMLSIFLAVAQSFIDSGFSNALIQKQNRTEIVNRALEHGLIIITAGSNVLRFVPPLVITNADVDEMIKKLESCF